ncbi:metal-dependent transcriptional regulator [Corynebacterium liangguodongii]|uniref:Diphtheria toxin repressor n=1 Tax=Corynebacterium liangguodongii TaxID=2079535 RepID=A0A2S0WC19_9CORY|nr:metal-dependent transcriptional regulator [Corynebacterium liangguodongii]AWB83317.1 metal-dependent transcriptional regulator [Corynebacterium liangguodongii]PWC00593.1 metal-dependent transcriptional regulator [Corynebacterium liangguodongii]
MHLRQLPERTQDYLKVMWNYEERHGLGAPIPLGELAKATGQKLPTASEAVKRLAAQGLVEHEKYAGVRLADPGRTLAVGVVRRHRLIETLLVRTLGYSWDEVHEEADMLEHAVSDRFLSRVDAFLGHPSRDPHGDPIPTADGTAEPLSKMRLGDVAPGDKVVFEQVNDADPELLRYLQRHGVSPGDTLEVLSAATAGLIQVRAGGGEFPIGATKADDIAVRRSG